MLPKSRSFGLRRIFLSQGYATLVLVFVQCVSGALDLNSANWMVSLGCSFKAPRIWLWVKTNGIPFWLVGAPPILEPILVGIG